MALHRASASNRAKISSHIITSGDMVRRAISTASFLGQPSITQVFIPMSNEAIPSFVEHISPLSSAMHTQRIFPHVPLEIYRARFLKRVVLPHFGGDTIAVDRQFSPPFISAATFLPKFQTSCAMRILTDDTFLNPHIFPSFMTAVPQMPTL